MWHPTHSNCQTPATSYCSALACCVRLVSRLGDFCFGGMGSFMVHGFAATTFFDQQTHVKTLVTQHLHNTSSVGGHQKETAANTHHARLLARLARTEQR